MIPFYLLTLSQALRISRCNHLPSSVGALVSAHEDIIEYKCLLGHVFNGTSVNVYIASCDDIFYIPPCVPVQCELIRPANTIQALIPSSLRYRESFSFACIKGTSVDGVAGVPGFLTAVCTAEGIIKYDPSMTTGCKKISCGVPPVKARATYLSTIDHVRYGSAAMYKCDENYNSDGTLSGSDTLQVACLSNGQFMENPSDCQPILCPDPPMLANASSQSTGPVYVGDVVHYVCAYGHHANISLALGRATSFQVTCMLGDNKTSIKYTNADLVCQ